MRHNLCRAAGGKQTHRWPGYPYIPAINISSDEPFYFITRNS
jgi:hypothetical protein